MRYLCGTLHYKLFLSRQSPCVLHAFYDSNLVGNAYDCTFTHAYIMFISHYLIYWLLWKQRIVARSSTKTEYRFVDPTSCEVIWIKALFHDLEESINCTPTIYCDNVNTKYLCYNDLFHSKMKHVEIYIHFVWDKDQSGVGRVYHVSSANHLVYSLTKLCLHLTFSYYGPRQELLIRGPLSCEDM